MTHAGVAGRLLRLDGLKRLYWYASDPIISDTYIYQIETIPAGNPGDWYQRRRHRSRSETSVAHAEGRLSMVCPVSYGSRSGHSRTGPGW
jgi:hypothetical protein